MRIRPFLNNDPRPFPQTECPKPLLHLLKYITNLYCSIDAVQICGKYWDTQYNLSTTCAQICGLVSNEDMIIPITPRNLTRPPSRPQLSYTSYTLWPNFIGKLRESIFISWVQFRVILISVFIHFDLNKELKFQFRILDLVFPRGGRIRIGPQPENRDPDKQNLSNFFL